METGKNIPFFSKKTKSQLMSEYKQIKENAYFKIFKMPAFILALVLVEFHYPNISNGTLTALIIFLLYIAIEVMLSLSQIEKKINILYQLETNLEIEANENGISTDSYKNEE